MLRHSLLKCHHAFKTTPSHLLEPRQLITNNPKFLLLNHHATPSHLLETRQLITNNPKFLLLNHHPFKTTPSHLLEPRQLITNNPRLQLLNSTHHHRLTKTRSVFNQREDQQKSKQTTFSEKTPEEKARIISNKITRILVPIFAVVALTRSRHVKAVFGFLQNLDYIAMFEFVIAYKEVFALGTIMLLTNKTFRKGVNVLFTKAVWCVKEIVKGLGKKDKYKLFWEILKELAKKKDLQEAVWEELKESGIGFTEEIGDLKRLFKIFGFDNNEEDIPVLSFKLVNGGMEANIRLRGQDRGKPVVVKLYEGAMLIVTEDGHFITPLTVIPELSNFNAIEVSSVRVKNEVTVFFPHAKEKILAKVILTIPCPRKRK